MPPINDALITLESPDHSWATLSLLETSVELREMGLRCHPNYVQYATYGDVGWHSWTAVAIDRKSAGQQKHTLTHNAKVMECLEWAMMGQQRREVARSKESWKCWHKGGRRVALRGLQLPEYIQWPVNPVCEGEIHGVSPTTKAQMLLCGDSHSKQLLTKQPMLMRNMTQRFSRLKFRSSSYEVQTQT